MLKRMDRHQYLTLLLGGLMAMLPGCPRVAHATELQDGIAHAAGCYALSDFVPSVLFPKDEGARIAWTLLVAVGVSCKEFVDPVFDPGDIACNFGGSGLALLKVRF